MFTPDVSTSISMNTSNKPHSSVTIHGISLQIPRTDKQAEPQKATILIKTANAFLLLLSLK